MSYSDMTIKNILESISNNEIFLPAIQRKFVWSHEQIEKLFDSLMLGYPIGTFLFWKVEKSKVRDYTFYKFIQEYHERDSLNELAPHPYMKDRIIGVLDGQQRLCSLYIALQGTYAYKKLRARWDNDDAFPKRQFYLNLLSENVDNDEEGNTYEFKFLTEAESSEISSQHFWFPVKSILGMSKQTECIIYAKEKGYLENNLFVENITKLWNRLMHDKVINYFEVVEDNLDNILDIFIRVNSGGTVLSKSDLLFSTIVAHWEKSREEIDELLKSINSKGERFNFDFDNDFIMRLCLVLTDSPVLFKVDNFKETNVGKIKNSWEDIKSSLKKTIDLLIDFGFCQENLTSKNAVIPIAYYIFKGGKTDADNKKRIRKYLIASLLKQVYGGKGDRVLETIRGAMRKEENEQFVLKTADFPIETLYATKLPAEKSLSFTETNIEEIFDSKKTPYTFMVLSLLYPQIKLGQVKFHQDHLHPYSSFSKQNLADNGVPDDKWQRWQELKDQLANLQLLEVSENESKSKTPLDIWHDNVTDKAQYNRVNFIPDVDKSLANFEQFIEERKILMKERFLQIMKV